MPPNVPIPSRQAMSAGAAAPARAGTIASRAATAIESHGARNPRASRAHHVKATPIITTATIEGTIQRSSRRRSTNTRSGPGLSTSSNRRKYWSSNHGQPVCTLLGTCPRRCSMSETRLGIEYCRNRTLRRVVPSNNFKPPTRQCASRTSAQSTSLRLNAPMIVTRPPSMMSRAQCDSSASKKKTCPALPPGLQTCIAEATDEAHLLQAIRLSQDADKMARLQPEGGRSSIGEADTSPAFSNSPEIQLILPNTAAGGDFSPLLRAALPCRHTPGESRRDETRLSRRLVHTPPRYKTLRSSARPIS